MGSIQTAACVVFAVCLTSKDHAFHMERMVKMSFELNHWEQSDYENLVAHIKSLIDLNYKAFNERLIPDVKNLLGVRMPKLKAIAKEITKGNFGEYLALAKSDYYEEIMLKGLVIGYCKTDNEIVFKYLEEFIPQIDNWAVCDCVCSGLKATTKDKEQLFNFAKKYTTKTDEFPLRFAIVLLMDFFIDDEHIDEVLAIFDEVKHEEKGKNKGYYSKMAIAWALSVCLIKQESKTMEYLKNNKLDDYTFNKSLQKIVESNRVTKERKDIIRCMKRKKAK